MSNLNLASILVSLGIFLSRFIKINEIIQNKIEEIGLEKKTSVTNYIRKKFNKNSRINQNKNTKIYQMQ